MDCLCESANARNMRKGQRREHGHAGCVELTVQRHKMCEDECLEAYVDAKISGKRLLAGMRIWAC